jgi:chemotaxis response regulator CheB
VERFQPIDRVRLDPTRGELPAAGTRPLRWMLADCTPGAEAAVTAMVRGLLPQAEPVPIAREGNEALARIRAFRPDLLILDLELPRMDGLTLLRALGSHRPPATLVLAPSTREGGRAAWEALVLGAKDVLPRSWCAEEGRWAASLRRSLRGLPQAAARGSSVRVRARRVPADGWASLDALVFAVPMADLPAAARAWRRIPQAPGLPVLFVTPHPPRYARALREGMDRLLPGPVRLATDRERLAPGVMLVPMYSGLRLEPSGGAVILRLDGVERARGRGSDARAALLSGLDGSGAPRIGVVLSTPPPAAARLWGLRAAASGRLFRLHAGATGRASLVQITQLYLRPAAQAA